MKNLFRFLAVVFLVLPLHAWAQFVPGAAPVGGIWFQCKVNSDCTSVKTACNQWMGVNKKYAKAYKSTLPKINPNDPGCPSLPAAVAKKMKNAPAQCVKNYCAVPLPKTAP
jgi:hypothetical protein